MNSTYNQFCSKTTAAFGKFYQYRVISSKPTDSSDVLIRLKKAHDKLQFSLEGSNNTVASANIAFLERDPSNRPPRATFQLEASTMVKQYIQQAQQEATIAYDQVLRHSKSSSAEEVNIIQSMKGLLHMAEQSIEELDMEIETAINNLNKYEQGYHEKD